MCINTLAVEGKGSPSSARIGWVSVGDVIAVGGLSAEVKLLAKPFLCAPIQGCCYCQEGIFHFSAQGFECIGPSLLACFFLLILPKQQLCWIFVTVILPKEENSFAIKT